MEEIEKVKEEQLPEKIEEQPVQAAPISKQAKAAKIIAIVAFSVVMGCLVLALVTDIAIFSKQILGFVAAILGSALVFIFGCILMLFSIVLIFGIYLLEQDGFWPATWAEKTFHEALSDAALTPDQVTAIVAVRIVLLVLCVLAFAAAIVAICMKKAAKKKNPEMPKQKLTTAFSIVALIFSIFGAFAALTVMLLSSLL